MIPVGLNTNYLPMASLAQSTKTQNDFQQLMQSLQSGDLSGAQAAYAALTSQSTNSGQSISSRPSSTANTLNADLTAVGKALQSGDLKAARQAFAQLQQDAQAAAGTRPHHHRRWLGPPVMPGSSTAGNASGAGMKPSATTSIDTIA